MNKAKDLLTILLSVRIQLVKLGTNSEIIINCGNREAVKTVT